MAAPPNNNGKKEKSLEVMKSLILVCSKYTTIDSIKINFIGTGIFIINTVSN